MPGYVVAEQDVEGIREPGDTAEIRVVIDRSCGSQRLEQRVVRFAPGVSQPTALDRQAVLYVVAGRGSLQLETGTHPLEPDAGAYLVAGETFRVENPGPDQLIAVVVTAPHERTPSPPERRTVRFADRPSLPAGSDREFRYLVDGEVGCYDLTQFVGLIAPGRAPMHGHVYDEVIFVLDGRGTLHLDGSETPIGPGSCIYLPPFAEHCLENTGETSMRVVAVFHPAGDPASRAYEANQMGSQPS